MHTHTHTAGKTETHLLFPTFSFLQSLLSCAVSFFFSLPPPPPPLLLPSSPSPSSSSLSHPRFCSLSFVLSSLSVPKFTMYHTWAAALCYCAACRQAARSRPVISSHCPCAVTCTMEHGVQEGERWKQKLGGRGWGRDEDCVPSLLCQFQTPAAAQNSCVDRRPHKFSSWGHSNVSQWPFVVLQPKSPAAKKGFFP